MPERKDPLEPYCVKRNFGLTHEPRGAISGSDSKLALVVQKHAATGLHDDFRFELDGVMLSWALPKGPSYAAREKPIAIQV